MMRFFAMLCGITFGLLLLGSVVGLNDAYAGGVLESNINTDHDEFPFKIKYHKRIDIEHKYGGKLFEELQGHKWNVKDYADSSNLGVRDLMNKLNTKIASDGSQARISDLNVSYDFKLIASERYTYIFLEVILEGIITDYIISNNSRVILIDLGWRGLSTNDEIIINGVEINIPINILQEQEPNVHEFFSGTEVEKFFTRPLINADSILEKQLPMWYYLFDPTGSNVDKPLFGIYDDDLKYGVSFLSMNDFPPRDSAIQETTTKYEIRTDNRYTVRDIKSYNTASIEMIGLAVPDNLNGVEIVKILLNPTERITTSNTYDELKNYTLGEIQWLEASYPLGATGWLRVIDPDMNTNQKYADTFMIKVWSDSDRRGTVVFLSETGKATGIFEGRILITNYYVQSENMIYVNEGDDITASYTDKTLPDSYSETELEVTQTTYAGNVFAHFRGPPSSNLRVVDTFGNSLDEVLVDQQVQIHSDVANGYDRDQAFAYFIQIQDGNGVTVSLSWITGSLSSGQSFSPSLSWLPTEAGSYTVTAFQWESIDNRIALGPPVSTSITVSHRN